MSDLTAEQAIYAKAVTEAHAHFSEVISLTSSWRLRPRFKDQYAMLSLRRAIEAFAFAAIAPNKDEYEQIRGTEKLGIDWHAKRIFETLEKANPDFFPRAVTGPNRTAEGKWLFNRPAAEPFPREVAEDAYGRCSELLHTANPWGDGNAEVDLDWLASVARNGLQLLHQHAAFIRARGFTGCWVVSRQPNGDWRFLSASAAGDFIINPSSSSREG